MLLGGACAGRHVEPALPFTREHVGIVEYRKVDLQGMDLRLSSGRCAGPLPAVGSGAVLASADGERARCRTRPYRGRLTLTAEDAYRRRIVLDVEPEADRDGRVRIEFATLDAVLRARGRDGLLAMSRVEIGRGGWAGIVDVGVLRSFRAEWHFRWIANGRGAPGLYVELHGGHAHGEEARALAREHEAARQRDDRARVEAGTLSPAAFSLRHGSTPHDDEARVVPEP